MANIIKIWNGTEFVEIDSKNSDMLDGKHASDFTLESTFNSHNTNTTVHVTSAEKSTWNEKASTAVASSTANGLMTYTDKIKLDTIATDATKNDTDANLKARSNHTGTQPASTISDFEATVRSTTLTGLSTETNAAITTSDTVLTSLGKLQKQTTDLSTQINGLGTASTKNTGTTSGTVPIIGSDGKLDSTILPAIAITDTFVVNSEADMLALTAQIGDVAIRSDLKKSYILKESPTTILENWQELLSPTGGVTSVAGKTGVVTLAKADVGLENVTNESKATMFTNPSLTGIPTAPTAATSTNSTQIATTAFVKAQGYLTSAGATAGTYNSVTISANGLVTAGSNPTTLAGYGITDAASATHKHAAEDITSGTLAIGRIPTGTTSSTVSLGNHSHASSKITALTGYTVATTNTEVAATDSLNVGLGKLQKQITDLKTVATTTTDGLLSSTDKVKIDGLDTTYLGISATAEQATKAATLTTARTINGTSFNGSANITTANWGTARTLTIGSTGKSVNGSANISWTLDEIGAAPKSHGHKQIIQTNRIRLGTATGSVAVAIPTFNPDKHDLLVYQNSTYIRNHATAGEYTLNGSIIVRNNSEIWPVGTILDFVVIGLE